MVQLKPQRGCDMIGNALILMTSFSFILGVAPLVVATGAGAEMRQSLGTAVLFGMIGVTWFGLLFHTRVFHLYS